MKTDRLGLLERRTDRGRIDSSTFIYEDGDVSTSQRPPEFRRSQYPGVGIGTKLICLMTAPTFINTDHERIGNRPQRIISDHYGIGLRV
jgi:hypothetical protein